MPNLNGKLLMNFYETDEGRHDTLIKVRGHYFSTEDVKYFLKELDDVTDAYVFVYHAGRVYLIESERISILQICTQLC